LVGVNVAVAVLLGFGLEVSVFVGMDVLVDLPGMKAPSEHPTNKNNKNIMDRIPQALRVNFTDKVFI
jgi:hypothetical protein